MAKVKLQQPDDEPIKFDPADQTDYRTEVTLKDGTQVSILGTPAATYAKLTDALARGGVAALETMERATIPVDPKLVTRVTCTGANQL